MCGSPKEQCIPYCYIEERKEEREWDKERSRPLEKGEMFPGDMYGEDYWMSCMD